VHIPDTRVTRFAVFIDNLLTRSDNLAYIQLATIDKVYAMP